MEPARNSPPRTSRKPPQRKARLSNIAARRTAAGWRWRANWFHDSVREWGPMRASQEEAYQDFLAMRGHRQELPKAVLTLKEAIDRLIEVSRNKGLAEQTIEDHYRARGKLFLSAWAPDTLLSRIDRKEVEWFIKVRREKHSVTDSTIYHDLAVLHRLFEVTGTPNPVKDVERPKPREAKRAFFTKAEVEQVIAKVRGSGLPASKRHADVLTLLFATGMRATEVERLRVKDVELGHGRIWVRGKNKPRELPIASHLRPVLARLVKDGDPEEPIIPGGAYYLARMCKVWQARLKLPALSARALRHSFATALLDGGCPVHVAQQLMGHADLETTARYLHTRDQSLRDAVELLRQTPAA
ncbi:MAG: tyrosine-type recombinase/integrase [Candidatus Aenigmarchaeota archaeon]|nr:tyrosine-type recombinase/integrase [Candidatus Aenigmarchaeota archaeon]